VLAWRRPAARGRAAPEAPVGRDRRPQPHQALRPHRRRRRRQRSRSIGRGEIVGFLGPNGAGKTTTLRMLAGLIRPSGGEGRILGERVPGPALRRVGTMIEEPSFYPYMTGRDNLRYAARLHGGVATSRVDEVLDFVKLDRRREAREGVLAGHAPAPRPRAIAAVGARGAAARRTDERARPGRHRRDPREPARRGRRRRHRPGQQPHPGRDREAGRPHPGDRQGQAGVRRTARRAPPPTRHRRRAYHLRATDGAASSPRCATSGTTRGRRRTRRARHVPAADADAPGRRGWWRRRRGHRGRTRQVDDLEGAYLRLVAAMGGRRERLR
jgi:hypothetical protein